MDNSINLKINLDLWVARDRGGDVIIFGSKPRRDDKYGWWDGDKIMMEDIYTSSLSYLFPNIENYLDFSSVRWEDEPKQLKDIIKKII